MSWPRGRRWREGDRRMSDKITKLMSANPNEFARSMEHLTRDMAHHVQGDATVIELPGGTAAITYTPKEGRRLSPLLVMPAADVSIAFEGVSDVDRTDFVAKFDLAFQRGGG